MLCRHADVLRRPGWCTASRGRWRDFHVSPNQVRSIPRRGGSGGQLKQLLLVVGVRAPFRDRVMKKVDIFAAGIAGPAWWEPRKAQQDAEKGVAILC
jgi:hypothetical protein